MNLLKETQQTIKRVDKTPEDIIYIGSLGSGHSCTWKEFCKLADKEYDASFGWAEVALDLCIVFNDGSQLERAEYDGSEWWRYYEKPKLPPVEQQKKITTLFISDTGWKTLAALNDEVG